MQEAWSQKLSTWCEGIAARPRGAGAGSAGEGKRLGPRRPAASWASHAGPARPLPGLCAHLWGRPRGINEPLAHRARPLPPLPAGPPLLGLCLILLVPLLCFLPSSIRTLRLLETFNLGWGIGGYQCCDRSRRTAEGLGLTCTCAHSAPKLPSHQAHRALSGVP